MAVAPIQSGAMKIRIEDILDRVESYRPELDENLMRHAYVFAANRHQGRCGAPASPT
jgi:(p)ppGpp synthase/HD superfamily hydrolase